MSKCIQVVDIETAIELYYSRIELSNADITRLFGVKGSTAIQRLKEKGKVLMLERDIPYFNPYAVNTRCAFEAWGLDIADLEKRAAKLRKLRGSA